MFWEVDSGRLAGHPLISRRQMSHGGPRARLVMHESLWCPQMRPSTPLSISQVPHDLLRARGSAMSTGYLVLALVTAAVNVWAAIGDFLHTPSTMKNVATVEVPPSWLVPLGLLKAAGAVGLLVGIIVPVIGVAAATGLVLFFVCAVFAHLRVRWYSTLPFPATFLALAVGSLVARLLAL